MVDELRSIKPLRKLPTLPDSNFPISLVVYLRKDKRLYRNKENEWVREVEDE